MHAIIASARRLLTPGVSCKLQELFRGVHDGAAGQSGVRQHVRMLDAQQRLQQRSWKQRKLLEAAVPKVDGRPATCRVRNEGQPCQSLVSHRTVSTLKIKMGQRGQSLRTLSL